MRALYAYIPVVHKGIIDLLNAYPDIPIWIMDNKKGSNENVYLKRDIRALPASMIKDELVAHGYKNIEVVDQETLAQYAKKIEELVIPEDEIVYFFIQKYAPDVRIKILTTFLRWTKPISTTEHEVPPDRIIATDEFHKEIMSILEIEARKSSDWWRQIAAALVKSGKVVAIASNQHSPTQHSVTINGDPRSNLDAGQGPGIYTSIHAEASVIAQAASRGISTKGGDLYVTTFPCPVCARSLIEAGIQRIYYEKGYSLLDAEEILKNAKVEIVLVR